MNTIDFIILATTGVSALIGISRGFIRELSSITAWILASLATFWDIPLVSSFMRSHFESAFIADIITGLSVFLIAFFIVSLIGTICSSFVRGTLISPIDRFFGTILGTIKGILLLSCIELISVCFIPRDEMPAQVQQSDFMPYLYDTSDWLRSIFPFQVRKFLDEQAHKNGALNSSAADHSESIKSKVKPNETTDQLKDLSTLTPKIPEETDGNYTSTQKEKLNKLIER